MECKGIFLFKDFKFMPGGKEWSIDGRTGLTKDKYRLKCDEFNNNEYNECYIDIIKDSNTDLFNQIPALLRDLLPYTKMETTWNVNIAKNIHTIIGIKPITK